MAPCKSKVISPCLGRCTLPKHRCLIYEEVRPGPVPKHLGWMYTARDSPSHQLRCGWRPGHISCGVLRQKERLRCTTCPSSPCVKPPSCVNVWPSKSSHRNPCRGLPLIKIVRHAGQYTICTEPTNISNSPAGPYPLKYVLNPSNSTESNNDVQFSIEAKFNEYQFDYSCSQSSFCLDFSPPPSSGACRGYPC